jgi:phytoene dehydrogenase-like protein
MEQFDIIVVGGGVNSLVTASILAQSGKKVLLLEARNQIGGLASTTEFAPGYKCNLVNDVVKWIDPRVLKKLDIESHGMELFSPDVVRIALDTDDQHIYFTAIRTKLPRPFQPILTKTPKPGKNSLNILIILPTF